MEILSIPDNWWHELSKSRVLARELIFLWTNDVGDNQHEASNGNGKGGRGTGGGGGRGEEGRRDGEEETYGKDFTDGRERIKSDLN